MSKNNQNHETRSVETTFDWYARRNDRNFHNKIVSSIKNDKSDMLMSIESFFCPRREISMRRELSKWTKCCRNMFWSINYGNLRRRIMMDSAEPSASSPIYFIHVSARKKMQFIKFNLRQSNISSNSHQRSRSVSTFMSRRCAVLHYSFFRGF